MSKNVESDRDLERYFDALRSQPERDPQQAARGRAHFLAQAEVVAKTREAILPLAVSPNGKVRHNRWMHALQTIFTVQKKERSPMFSTLSTVLLIVSLVLGGSGVTLVAAQQSTPDQPLYAVKTWSEDVHSGLVVTEQSRLQFALDLAERRGEEMMVMLRAGKTPPEMVQARMQQEIDLALKLAAGQSDEDVTPALLKVREQLREQEQAFLHLGTPAGPQAEALLDQVRTMLRDRLQLCDDGLLDPQLLRDQLRDRDRDRIHTTDDEVTPLGTGAGNPWTDETPFPGSGYGPGSEYGDGENNPWTDEQPTPGTGYGPGSEYGDGENNPWTDEQPTPGSSYGPGPQAEPGSGNPSDNGGGMNGGMDNDSGSNGSGTGTPASDTGDMGGNDGGKGPGH